MGTPRLATPGADAQPAVIRDGSMARRSPKGNFVMLINGSATRDEPAFPDADKLDFDRKLDPRAIHFGFGIHKCLGIHPARVELRARRGQLNRGFGLI